MSILQEELIPVKMTNYTLNPKVIIADLLREVMTDPRTSRESTNSETLSAGATSYTLTATTGSPQVITSLTIGGVAQEKWKDYFYDWQNFKILLPTAAAGEVVVNYKQGNGWIYPDKSNTKLSATSFPRISVLKIAGAATRFGNYKAPMEESIALQLDFWVKRDFIYTDPNGFKWSNDKLADYLISKAKKNLSDNEDKLHCYGYSLRIPTSDRDLPFDEEYQAHHKLFILEFDSTNEGEIEI